MHHRWSGWPGAFCLDCGAEDAFENAMGMGWVDIYEDENGNCVEKWDTEEHKQLVKRCNEYCPVNDKPSQSS